MSTTTDAISRWEAFGAVVESDYYDAYTSQAGALREVKETIEGRRKDEEAALNFALNILTIGIASGLATAAEKYVVQGIAEHAAKAGFE